MNIFITLVFVLFAVIFFIGSIGSQSKDERKKLFFGWILSVMMIVLIQLKG